MKAIVLNDFGSTENFSLAVNYQQPEPGAGEVLIRIRAVGFNPVDYQMRLGKTEKNRMRSNVLGREFSGTVVRSGSDSGQFRAGDKVFAASGSMGSNGSYAEYIVVPEAILARMPSNLSFVEAAAIPTAYITARQTINRLGIENCDRVFIAGGAGGVGQAVIKMLLSMGIANLITTAGSQDSRQRLIEAGLTGDQIFDYRENNLDAKILAGNQGQLFEHVIDLVGGQMSEVSAGLLSLNGNYADITALSTATARGKLFDKGASILLISNYAHTLLKDYAYFGNTLTLIGKDLEDGIITPPPIETIGDLSVHTVASAHQLLENNQTRGRKLVMQVLSSE